MSFSCAPVRFRIAALSSFLLAAGCSDRLPLTPAEPPSAKPGTSHTQVQCSVDVPSGQVTCGAPAASGGASQNLILGGQGTYVRLASTSPSYDAGTGIFQVSVTVQNLTDQRVGTDDGTRTTGLRVFFNSGPTATGGTGSVTVANPDGRALFLATEQPFFSYPEILEPRGTSASKVWRFAVAPGVTHFHFGVYVEAESPVEQGVLRWVRERGGSAGGASLRDVWAASPTRIFAVGDDGSIALYDGARWMGMPSPTGSDLQGVWGTSDANVYAVGDDGVVARFDGNRWSTIRGGFADEMLQEVWGSSASDIWVAGLRKDLDVSDNEYRLLLHYDGTSWTEVAAVSGGIGALWGVWGTGPANLYVSGEEWNASTGRYDGVLDHFNGTAWSRVAALPSAVLAGIWGSGPGDVYAVGQQYNAGTGHRNGVIHHFDGTSWTTTTSAVAGASRAILDIWGTGSGAVHAVGLQYVPGTSTHEYDAVILRSSGTGWTEVVRTDEGVLESVWGTAAGDVFAVGSASGALRFDGATWTRQMGAGADFEVVLRGVWGADASVFAVGEREWSETSVLLQRTGGGWGAVTHPAVARLSAVWGRSAGQVFAVGSSVLRYNGTAWVTDAISATNVSDIALNGVWGGTTGSVYAVGTGVNSSTFEPRGVMLASGGTGSWSLIGSIPSANRSFHALWGTSGSNIFVVGCNGSAATILRWTGTWSETTVAGGTRCLRAVWGSAANDVYAAGDGGLLMHFDGTAWTTVASGTTATLRGIWGSAASEVYVVGNGGVMLRFNGTGWTQASSGSSAALQAIWGSASTDVYTVGDGLTVLHGTR